MGGEIANMDEPFPVSPLPHAVLGDTYHVPHGLISRMPCRNRAPHARM